MTGSLISPFTKYRPAFPIQKVNAFDVDVLGAIVELVSISFKYCNRILLGVVGCSFVIAISKSFRGPPKLRRKLHDQNDSKLTGNYSKPVLHLFNPLELIAKISTLVL